MIIKYRRNILNIICLVTLALILNSCDFGSTSPEEPGDFSRGDIVSTEFLGSYSLGLMQYLLIGIEFPGDVALTYSVDAYKIIYRTIDWNDNIIDVSGVIFLPVGADTPPLISTHHGTQTKRENVGSVNPMNAPEGLISASMGYIACSADYIGLGESQIIHPYHSAKLSAAAVIDLLRASKTYLNENGISYSDELFLAGYSEGGYVTLAAHKEIEENYSAEFNITACAPMAGAYDLYSTAHSFMELEEYDSPAFLVLLIAAFDEVYGWNRLNDFFNSNYAEIIPTLLAGTLTTGQINDQLPTRMSELFNPVFLESFTNGNEPEVDAALIENTLLNWSPSAPIRLFHGNADQFVPYTNALTTVDNLTGFGATIDLVTIDGGDHYTSIIPSLFGTMAWFNTFRSSPLLFVSN